MSILRTIVLGGSLAAVTLATASPALADRGRYYRGGGDTTGAAIAGGIVGLAVGAAIASSSRDRGRDYYYDGPRYPRARAYYVYRDYPRYHAHPRWEHRGWHRDYPRYRGWDGPRYWAGRRHWDDRRGW